MVLFCYNLNVSCCVCSAWVWLKPRQFFCFPKGKAINITWTVKNVGVGVTAHGAWYDRVYLSKDDKRG